jgi:hypothetical protein
VLSGEGEHVDTVGADSLNWAITHLLRYGDTDVLPIPFEFQATVKAFQPAVVAYLCGVDLAAYRTRPFIRVLAPKVFPGFRVMTQLDPLDTILLTAATYEVAPAVELFRAAPDLRVSCSYRLKPQPDGTLFAADTGWTDYHQKSTELATSGQWAFVVCADIADFYNQVYHHRIENALETAGVPPARAKSMEGFLSSLTAKTSRGIPIGPVASTILSEACLADVDAFLQRRKIAFTRYVDDFRLFVANRAAAQKALHDLTDYLYQPHRLSLQGSKTRIMDVEKFRAQELRDPGEMEESSKRQKLIEAAIEMTGYVLPFDETEEIDVPPDVDFEAVSQTLVELYDDATKDFLLTGTAKHALRRASTLRVRGLIPLVLDRLPHTVAVLPSVVTYLLRMVRPENQADIGDSLRSLLKGEYGDLPFVRTWCLHAFAEAPGLCKAYEALALADGTTDLLIAGRYAALLARAHRILDWVREHKETWANNAPYVQRAIVWASTILPRDERRPWLDAPENSGDPLLRFVARAAKQV